MDFAKVIEKTTKLTTSLASLVHIYSLPCLAVLVRVWCILLGQLEVWGVYWCYFLAAVVIRSAGKLPKHHNNNAIS